MRLCAHEYRTGGWKEDSGGRKKTPGGIELRITNEELANAAAVTVFAVSKFMREWHRSGAVVKTRGKVLVRSPELLFREAGKESKES
jgi:hypothetical protein